MLMREILQSDAGAVNALVSSAFGYQAPRAYFDDFPVWASDEVVRLGLFEGSQLISHVGYRIAEIRTSRGGTEKLALIGAVATDASHRGKGLSTTLLREALTRIEKASCTWSILWGSEHAFYEKLGFQLSGLQGRAPLSSLTFDTQNLASATIQTGFNEKILNALLSVRSGIILKDKDQNWIKNHHTVKWFSIQEPFAFVGFERGMDLPHIIHEAGGDARSLEKLLFKIYSTDPDAQMIAPIPVLSQIGFPSEATLTEYLCIAKPTKPGTPWNDQFWISGISAC